MIRRIKKDSDSTNMNTSLARKRLLSFHKSYVRDNLKMSDRVLEILESNMKLGVPANHCCSLAGIHFETYCKWIKRGEDYFITSLEAIADQKEICYGEFSMRMKRSIASWQKGLIKRSFTGNRYNIMWKRDLKLLERRDKSNWSPNYNISLSPGSVVEDYKYL